MEAHWHLDPSVVLALIALTGWYLAGTGLLRQRVTEMEQVSRGKALSFFAGILVIYLALGSPLHDLAEGYLFSAHMVQHELLVLVAAPLLLAGTPGRLLRPALRLPGVLSTGRLLTNPIFAFLAFNVIFSVWHYPPLYESALRNHGLHIVEHLTFMLAGVLFWWPVLSALAELPPAPQIGRAAYLLAEMFPCSAVGAFISLPASVLYPWYSEAPRIWNISALADQQIGGVIMWAGGNAFFMVAAVVIFFRWADRQQDEMQGTLTTVSGQ